MLTSFLYPLENLPLAHAHLELFAKLLRICNPLIGINVHSLLLLSKIQQHYYMYMALQRCSLALQLKNCVMISRARRYVG